MEYKEYSLLTDEELVILSMIAVSNETYMQTNAISDLSAIDVAGCISSALGIPASAAELGISGLISAKTGLQVLKAVAKRYVFGYVALALSVYQFGDCIYKISK